MTTLLPLVLIFAVLCVLDVDEIILRHVDSDPARGAGGAGMDVPWVLRGVWVSVAGRTRTTRKPPGVWREVAMLINVGIEWADCEDRVKSVEVVDRAEGGLGAADGTDAGVAMLWAQALEEVAQGSLVTQVWRVPLIKEEEEVDFSSRSADDASKVESRHTKRNDQRVRSS
jgi:hypothetical protein